MRGEYHFRPGWRVANLELPPHARRILPNHHKQCRTNGTTSACAENTMSLVNPIELFRNYLRMRGEYFLLSSRCAVRVELPPHARRIRCVACVNGSGNGTTSACAENTRVRCGRCPHEGNYLRMRGEYDGFSTTALGNQELPPHARRIPYVG